MERWLTQRMSASLGSTPGRSDGICANVEFPFPRRLAGDAVAAASGIDPETDPWLPQRAVWPLLDVVGECLDEPWLASLARHLGDETDADRRSRRFATVRHLAELFDHYALHRPAMVCGWARGEVDLPNEAAWQAELWRRLRERLGTPSPAERLEPACERLRADPVAPRPSRAHLALRPDAAADRPPRRAARARGRPRGPRLPPPPLTRAVGEDRRPRAGRPPCRRPHRVAPRQPAARLLGPGRARDAARARHARARRPPPPESQPGRRHAPQPHPGRRARRPLPARASRCPAPPTPARRSPRATAASRSTPATAARDRSRSCATRSSTCWRRTTRCSRAT